MHDGNPPIDRKLDDKVINEFENAKTGIGAVTKSVGIVLWAGKKISNFRREHLKRIIEIWTLAD